jgi:hypothetical protein
MDDCVGTHADGFEEFIVIGYMCVGGVFNHILVGEGLDIVGCVGGPYTFNSHVRVVGYLVLIDLFFVIIFYTIELNK